MATSNGWTAEQAPDLSGKVAIVTGANSGIGYETARALAKRGADVILACRDMEKAAEAQGRIASEQPAGSVEAMRLDLASLESVRAFADAFKNTHEKLDILCNNAGVMAIPFRKTADGFEMQFGTNHLGHFALTASLMDRLSRSDGARVVNVSSLAHTMGVVDFENLNAEHKYSKWGAYGLSKLSNLLFTYELARRFESNQAKTIAAAAHPGWTATNLQNPVKIAVLLNPIFAQREEMGALPTLYAAAAADVKNGEYFGPSGWREMRGYPKRVRSNRGSHDAETAAKLWEVSEKLTGVEMMI